MAQVLDRPRTEHKTEVFTGSGIRDRRSKPKWLYGLGAVLFLAAAIFAWRSMATPAAAPYATVTVARDTVSKTITATGKVQALRTVEVGSQISGTIADIYVDFNDQVKKGQVIARLDPEQLQAQLTQALANQTSMQASVQTAQFSVLGADASVEAAAANVERMKSLVEDAQLNLERTQELVNEGIGARNELDAARAAHAQAVAQRQQAVAQVNQVRAQAQSARSQLSQARAQVTQAGAAIQVASVNLQRATITAPIDGVIVARNVNVGQTVAASLQAPVLFLIANDLTRMQVLADIDEADVGQLQPNSRVAFTVDAYPSETFEGEISQVRLSPQTVQNVTTYTAVIDVANPDLKLKPGMTASITATVAQRDNVLVLPNSALRFKPEGVQTTERGPVVWRVSGEGLEPVKVRLGLSDGVVTEVASGGLREGDAIAVPAQAAAAGGAQSRANNPFMPGRRGGGRR